jgi:hypothetical protein
MVYINKIVLLQIKNYSINCIKCNYTTTKKLKTSKETKFSKHINEVLGLTNPQFSEIPTARSFEQKLLNIQDLSGISEKQKEALVFFKKRDGTNLPIDTKSKDCCIIKDLSEDTSIEVTSSFGLQDDDTIIGSCDSKQMAVEIFKYIRNQRFSDTEEGEVIYAEYGRFIKQCNVPFIERNQFFQIDDKILKNVIHYTLLALPIDETITLADFLTQMNGLFSSTGDINSYNITSNPINCHEIIQQENISEIKKIEDQKLQQIDEISASKRSIAFRSCVAT